MRTLSLGGYFSGRNSRVPELTRPSFWAEFTIFGRNLQSPAERTVRTARENARVRAGTGESHVEYFVGSHRMRTAGNERNYERSADDRNVVQRLNPDQ